jgi:hypothetical protein
MVARAMAAVATYLFVIAFGAVRPGEILPVTLGMGVLALLCVGRALHTHV